MEWLLIGKKGLLFGNEAIVRGALESGVGFASTYPGTPASEIGDIFAKIAKDAKIYFEYSTNEKVALEAAAGAAFSGIKAIVPMKQYGLNVALDSLLPLTYLECPLVVIIGDDPGCWSSVQTEQDSRLYSRLGHIPMLEPSNSQEAKTMTKLAFQLAWKYKIPFLIRMTTRTCYSRSLVNYNKIIKSNTKGNFVKPKPFKMNSEQTITLHKNLLEKLNKIKILTESSGLNFIETGKGNIGIITSGICYEYVKEALQKLNVALPLLKIGFIYPFPEKKVAAFLKNLKSVIIVEELDPIIEEEVKKIVMDRKNKKIYGKNLFSETNELRPEYVLLALSKLLNKKIPKELAWNTKNFNPEKVEKRTPFFCAGCPHLSTFYAVKKILGRNKIFCGDIGCYTLGICKPHEMQDLIVSMGAGIGISHGIAKMTGQKPVIFIGDSTFFHAGIPALINLVYNKSNALLIILDNRFTAMTGRQPHPGTGWTGLQELTKALIIEDIAKACQADFVQTSNVYNFKQFCQDIKEAYAVKGVSVVVAKGECRLYLITKLAREGVTLPKYEIIKQKPELDELEQFGCIAIRKDKSKWLIDKNLCWGCSLCKQLFPDCIAVKENKK